MNKEYASAEKKVYSKEVEGLFSICEKLTLLESEWEKILGPENSVLAKKCRPGRCKLNDDGTIELTLFVSDISSIQGLKFKRKFLQRKTEQFLSISTEIFFELGNTVPLSNAKRMANAVHRRAPVRISKESIEEEKREMLRFTEDEDLAERLSKIKIIAEKIAKREK